jgi:hypothetical protein
MPMALGVFSAWRGAGGTVCPSSCAALLPIPLCCPPPVCPPVYKDHITLADYEIHDGMG